MAHPKEMDHALSDIEGVDNAIIADAKTIAVCSCQVMMRERSEALSHFINLGFNARANRRCKFEEASVKARVIDLQCRAHHRRSRLPNSRLDARCQFTL